MFVRTKSHSLGRHWPHHRGRHWPHHRGRAALRYALVLALLALTLFTGPQPARAVATASSTPGTVVAWGSSIEDASTVPGNLSDVIAIAAGGYQNLALKSDGTVVAWGNNNFGQGNIPTGLANVTAIAAGNGHNLALKADGTVVAWGSNFDGQATVPAGLSGVTAIAAAQSHSLALKGDGTVVAWGYNEEGQATVPAGLSGVTAIATNETHSLALKGDGTVVAWGSNAFGQLNIRSALANVSAIAAGALHSLALKSDGTVVAWGNNNSGQGNIPSGLATVTAIAAGNGHNLALKADGTVVAWGGNFYGQASVPAGLSGVTAIAAGIEHSLALVGSVAAPEIDVLGNGTSIVSGDSTPVTTDHTDFGSADVDGGTVVRTFTIENSGDAALTLSGSPLVAISGDQAAEFTVTALPSSPVAGGGSTTFQLTFDPGAAGTRTANVTIANDDGDENPYTFAVQGTGTTPPIPGTVVAWGSNLDGASTVPSDLTDVIAIAAGVFQNLALKSDGTVVAWGDNTLGQGNIPTGLATVTAIAAGYIHNLALKADGTVVAWGNNDYRQATVPAGLTGVTAIAAGAFHSLALKADSTVVAWGNNDYRQATVPAGLANVTAIAAGEEHSLALKGDGTVVAWGSNTFGQLNIPSALANVSAIAAGAVHSLALKGDGTVVAWGDNSAGQATVPAGLSGVTAIAAGGYHSLALKADGTVVAWGSNSDGQASVPTGLSGVTAIAAGSNHSVALVGSVAAPEIDVLGNGTSIANGDSTPVTTDHTDFGSADVDGGTMVRTFTIENSGDAALTLSGSPLVAISGDHAAEFTVTALPSSPVAGGGSTTFQLTFDPGAAGIRTATVTIANDDGDENPYTFAVQGTGTTPPIPGTVIAWGSNLDGASTVPGDLSDVIAIAAGGIQNLALKSDGTVVAWGANYDGQGTIPTGLANVTAIAAGNGHNLALKRDGTVVAWGLNSIGQATVPAGLSGVTAIASGSYHSLALKGDDTVVAWGFNNSGQATVPAGLSGVTAIAAGNSHSLALKEDGTVVAWGSNSFGQATVPGNLANVTAISAGTSHSLALKEDGTVVAWGANFSGQATVPSDLTNVIAIAAGQSHSLALKRDGTVVAWGSNNIGQISVPGNLANVTAIAAGSNHSVALVGSVAAPEIDVLGNGVSIVSGDSTPVTTDHTDFGSADVDGGTVVRTFTIKNSGDANLTLSGSPLVAISGNQAAEFTVTALPSSPVAASGSTTFQITFDPGAAGIRTATVTIANDDGDENSYTFAVQGTGFLPNVQFNGTACDLIDAINAANSDSASGTCPAGSGADTITLLSDITLSAINNTNNFGSNGLPQITSDITIEGDGHTLSRAAGASLFRFFDVDASGTLTLNRLTLHNGDALDANASIAGAIFNWGTVTVNNSTLSNNNGRSGGAIYNFGGTLTVNNSTFSGNTTSAFGDGGAISNSATMTVNNSTFSGNSSSKGGAINNSGTATVNSSTFSGNAATNQGGAIYNGGDNTLTLARSLLSGNSAADGAELYNEPAGFMPAGIVNSNNGNLFGQSGNAGTSGFTPTASDLVPSVGLSAILASLADNSGGTQTHALVAGSPAIDAAGDSGLATDQRGIARPQGCADDIGAFELDGVTCPSPEIDVQGNGVSIANGDSTPATADHTAFGSAEINSGTVVRTFTIHNSGDAALSAIAVRVEGYEPAAAHSGAVLPFSLTSAPATTVAAGQSTQFQITFAPSESGESSAVVIIESNDANEGYYVFVISGEGVTPPQATITIVLDARPEIQTNLGFQSSFGPFILDDSAVDDGDTYTNTKSFTVAPGSYSVTRNNPTTWFTTAIACTPDGNATINLPQRRATITVVSGDNVTCTFTVERAVRITARAFNDLVRNSTNLGKRNAGDPWQPGWSMSVAITPTAPITNQVTGGSGTIPQAFFSNLRSGSYVVCATLPDSSWTPTTPTANDPVYGQPCKSVTLTPGQAATVLFGAYETTVVASETVTPEDEIITDDDAIVNLPYDPAEDETTTDEDGARRLFLPLVAR